ncbi:hypothetical protein ACMD2_15597 [Ananas comosus]|uniref:Uncharacterized protein n=1 Tax=Ananas comosus TaxID=4615 RepID=A0A199V172_ANACO|nr:hypothetical protein ACMD2_15597 [Ananas comosus]
MSKLQRSSVSFRRQGSSGLIWDGPHRGLDPKSTAGAATPRAAASRVVSAGVAAPPSSPRLANGMPPYATPPKARPARRRRPLHGCGFSATLFTCVKPHSTTPAQ